MQPRVSIIAAIGKNREIGRGSALLWRIPEDLKRFRSLTMGHPVIMGRTTFESIGKPLPGRTNIVITKLQGPSLKLDADVVLVAHSPQDALTQAHRAPGSEEIFIIGGASIYAQTLPLADRLYLTLIDDAAEADAFFPPYEQFFTKKLSEESGEFNGVSFRWVTLER